MSPLCMSFAVLFYRAMLNAHIFKLLSLNFAFFTSGHFKNKDKDFFTALTQLLQKNSGTCFDIMTDTPKAISHTEVFIPLL